MASLAHLADLVFLAALDHSTYFVLDIAIDFGFFTFNPTLISTCPMRPVTVLRDHALQRSACRPCGRVLRIRSACEVHEVSSRCDREDRPAADNQRRFVCVDGRFFRAPFES